MKKFSTLGSQDNAAQRVTVIGVDLAKNVFALHGINAAGAPILVRPNVRRDQLLKLLVQLPPCVIGMEACSGAHHLARALIPFGHTPKLMHGQAALSATCSTTSLRSTNASMNTTST